MRQIVITIFCEDAHCGSCELVDMPRLYCPAFDEWLEEEEDGTICRCSLCIEAEDQANSEGLNEEES